MGCVLLFLVLSTFVFCDDVHIHKVVEDITGWSEADTRTIDKIADQTSDNRTGQADKQKYDELMKNQYKEIWEKTLKFRETATRVRKENRAAIEFIKSVLNYALSTRHGGMKEDDASKKVEQDWDKLADDVKAYLITNFPALQEFSHFVKKI